ncbi:MAG TPA: hypothetical protein VL049_19415 [Candidatus Dormibacteraeota bacterium]|nr:hypothetical protein [Candidatus Dormibacteraeota bacterium]
MRCVSLAAAIGLLFSAGLAMAGTKVQGNIVPNDAGSDPKLDAKSKFKLAGTGDYKVGLKGITDSVGNPAPVTSGTTPDTQYFLILKGDATGVLWEYNVPFNITKEGQAKVQGSVALISAVPAGSAVGVLGIEIHEPTPAMNAADCTTLLTNMALPGVFIPGAPFATNPCASGARVGISGVVTGN